MAFGGMKTYTSGTTPQPVIDAALGGERYPMSLVGDDANALIEAVNQGIDSHLEAFTRSTFAWDNRGRLECNIAPAEMNVLLRRLMDTEDGEDLRSCILETLNIEEV